MAFCTHQLAVPVQRRVRRAVCTRRVGLRLSAGKEEEDETLQTYRGKGDKRRSLSGGELLPFDVTLVSPPPRSLGRFKLDSRTHCGDVIEQDGTHFVVKRVTRHYGYGVDGQAVVIRKSVDVKTFERRSIEISLERSLQQTQED